MTASPLILPIVHLAVASTCLLTGCASRTPSPGERGLAVVLPGAGGDGPAYTPLRDALRADRFAVVTHEWGAPLPLFVLNFSNRGVHDAAEKSLRDRLSAFVAEHPGAPVVIVGHSAGCGVALGALGDPAAPTIDALILLAPSVSPGYDLGLAAQRVRGRIDSFYSDRDVTFLKWRTSHFGGYDGVKSPAAGHLGFDASDRDLPPNLAQHQYDPAWRSLGHDGGHFGPLAGEFVRQVIVPLLREMPTRPADNSR